MDLKEKIRQSVLKFLKIEDLAENPNSPRYQFISDEEKIRCGKIEEFKVWYYGNSDELLNFYTEKDVSGFYDNVIYNRNKRQYFWALSAEECGIKRVHSGVPHMIVNGLTNIVGMPQIECEARKDDVDAILEHTDFTNLVNQKQMPMTLALGWGAFKIIIDKEISPKYPLIEWYNADDVDFIVKHGKVVGIIYKDYLTKGKTNYVICETRYIKNGNSYIDYQVFKLLKNNSIQEVKKENIPELKGVENKVLNGYNHILGVPSVFYYDQYNEGYGRSLFEGKLDLFDDLDQDLSQASQVSRVSTPVEYIPADMIGRTAGGMPKLPHIFNRQYVADESYPDGNGNTPNEIKTTQPVLNFDQYYNKAMNTLTYILSGDVSPASFGIDIARNDNAMAQREKEKVTIMTRNNIIDKNTKMYKDLVNVLLWVYDYMNGITRIETDAIDYDVSVKYDEFASPTFETMAQTLLPMYVQGGMSEEMYINKLYGDSLSDEEKAKEIKALKKAKESDNLMMGDFELNGNAGTTTTDLPSESGEEEGIIADKETML